MSGISIHFLQGGINSYLESNWLYLAGGAALIVLCLLVVLVFVSKRKKTGGKKKSSKPVAPAIQPAKPDENIQSILKTLPKSNGQAQTVLLAASCLNDLPVTVPVNLAIHLSAQGKCLLIDLDSKRDAMAKVFDIDSETIDIHLKVAPIQTSFENLSIWPARYFDLLKQMDLRSLLATANKDYSHILLYAPYLTVLADRKQIASISKQAVVFGKQDDSDSPSQLHRLLKTYHCKVLCEV
ncbi:MAG: hypothetical protein ABFR90_01960 [Planctomycetota bacterium]